MGEIRKRRGSKVLQIRYYRNGRRYEESARTTKWEEARDLLKKREGDIANGVPISPKIARLRVEEALDDLLTDYRINGKRSLAHVERHAAKLKTWFAGRRMADLTGAEFRRYIEGRQKVGAANATINRELAALRRTFSLAVDAGKLIAKPKIRLLVENNARQGFFEHDQFVAVRSHLPAPLQGIATFAYFTGWRRSEILNLDWQRLDRKACVVRLDVGTTKNRDGREFHYGALDDVRAMLEAQWTAHEALRKAGTLCPYVFQRFDGKRVSSFRKAWATACRKAGVPGRLLHDFRRTAVRNLERAGVSRSVAMKVTGHRTEAVYRRYAIVSSGDLAEAARKLQSMATGTISGTIGGFHKNTSASKASA